MKIKTLMLVTAMLAIAAVPVIAPADVGGAAVFSKAKSGAVLTYDVAPIVRPFGFKFDLTLTSFIGKNDSTIGGLAVIGRPKLAENVFGLLGLAGIAIDHGPVIPGLMLGVQIRF